MMHTCNTRIPGNLQQNYVFPVSGLYNFYFPFIITLNYNAPKFTQLMHRQRKHEAYIVPLDMKGCICHFGRYPGLLPT